MKIYILSRQFLYHYRVDRKYKDTKHALISIIDPGSKLADHPFHKFNYLLLLSFYDIEHDTFDDGNGRIYNALSDKDANDIKNFVDVITKDNVGVLIVQCEAGISRSAAVAAAVAKYVNKDNNWIFKCGKFAPNMYVYRKVMDALFDNSRIDQ